MAKNVWNEENLSALKKIIEQYREDKGALMPILQRTQESFGYIPQEAVELISEELNISLAKIYGVITFYAQFKLEPSGKYLISVCLGTACYVRGAQSIIDKIKDHLKLAVGETTEDMKFSLEATRCIGACGLAPVMTINEDVYGKLKLEDIDSILEKYNE